MVCQTLEQVTHLSWLDQITTIAIFSRTIRQKQGQVTSRVWCGQIITIKLSVTKVEARDEQKIVQPDHHCHTICHDSVVRQTKEQGTNLDLCDQIITILSSAIPVLCDHKYPKISYIGNLLFFPVIITITTVFINHYPVICYSSIVWPYQHNHDMRDNSITLQTIEVTYSGWCDLIITSMLSFSTVFCDKYRNKWPADLVRSSWSYNLSKEYGKPSIQASH